MTTSRFRLLVLAVGLLAAGSASAATLSVYARMSGPTAVGVVTTAAGSAASTINCATNSPANCVDAAATGVVILEPGAGTNATFVNWSGCTSVAGTQCTVNMTASRTVSANFRATNQTLTAKTYPVPTATFTPAYGGTLAAPTTPAIASCQTGSATSGNCTGEAAYNTDVVVTATPNGASKVESWSGCKSSTATTCTVAITAAKIVSATFGSKYAVALTGEVSGPGRIAIAGSSTVDGMTCGPTVGATNDCTAGVPGTANVTVTATADSGATFQGWGGLCSTATGTSCTITTAQLTSTTLAKVIRAGFKTDGCGSCHSKPVSHAPYGANCGQCHGGYTASTVDSTNHMNASVNLGPYNTCQEPPANFGVTFEVVGAGFTQNAGTLDDTAYVDVIVRFDGATVGTDLPASFSPNQWGSSGQPRFAIGEVLADGSFKSVLVTSNLVGTTPAGTTSTSQTATLATDFALQDAATGTYRFTFWTGTRQLPGRTGGLTTTSGVRPLDGLDLAKPYRAVMYGARYFTPAANTTISCAQTQFPTSDYLDFSPTGTSSDYKATVTDAKCNACHGAVNLHGRRRGVVICLTCHNPNTPLGAGNTVAFKWDLKNVAHKFHSGLNYDGINPMTGVAGSSWGTTLDATGVAQGPSHQTYFEGGGTATTSTADDAVHQLPTQIQCVICHDTTKTSHLVASQAGCSSCHPINWVTGAGHGASYPTVLAGETGHPHTDAECAGCHPVSGQVVMNFGAVPPVITVPVKTVHSALWEPKTGYDFNLYFDVDGTTKLNTVNFSGTSYPGVPEGRHQVDVQVTDFQVNATNGRPTISFTVTLDGQPYQTLLAARTASLTANLFASSDVLGGRWPTCAFTLAGPAGSDYVIPATGSNNLSCGAADATNGSDVRAVNAALGQYSVTPNTNLNATGYPVGTYTLSYEMLYQRQAGNADGLANTADDAIVRKPFAVKPYFYTVTKSGTATAGVYAFLNANPRRHVVSFDKCNNCHVQIGFHSNQGRQGPDYCAVCHNPKLDNATRIRALASSIKTYPGFGATEYYLPESVSMNVFIHRIHMGEELPSVASAANASPWVPEPGRIVYGALRGTASVPTEADLTNLSGFAMPNPMGRCNGCHLDGTWAMPETARAPVERTLKTCATTVTDASGVWCEASLAAGTTANQLPKGPLVVTPPLKAVCTSCHDDLATDSHADALTTNPMSATAVETCKDCHGTGAPFDVIKMHPPIP